MQDPSGLQVPIELPPQFPGQVITFFYEHVLPYQPKSHVHYPLYVLHTPCPLQPPQSLPAASTYYVPVNTT